MGAGRNAGLSIEQIESMTDLMVSKLCHAKAYREPSLPPGEISRDEIRLVVVDTVILCESEDPSATLEGWLSSDWDQRSLRRVK